MNRTSQVSQLVLGALSGLSILCVLWADNWFKLGVGLAALAGVIIWAAVMREKTIKPTSELLLELGPPIHQVVALNKKAMVLLGSLVALLGLAGLGMALGSTEDKNTDAIPGALFLFGAGLACLAIPNGQRQLLAISYLVWAIAGAVMIFLVLAQADSNVAVARGITLGSLLLISGLVAVYGFTFSKTVLTAEGLVVGRSLVPWNVVKSWTIVDDATGVSNLRLQYNNSPSMLTAQVPKGREEEASKVLTTHLGPSSIL